MLLVTASFFGTVRSLKVVVKGRGGQKALKVRRGSKDPKALKALPVLMDKMASKDLRGPTVQMPKTHSLPKKSQH
jgi:hypothetical protein